MRGYIRLLISIIFCLLLNLDVLAIDEVIRVAFDPNNPPFQFMEDGKAMGIHIDMLNYIATKNNFHLYYIPVQGEYKCLESIINNQADIALGINNNSFINNDSNYYDGLTQSDVLTQSDICIIALKEKSYTIEDMLYINNFSTAIENNSVNYSYLQGMKNLQYRVVGNQREAFLLITEKETDLLVGNRSSILYQLDREKLMENYIIINNYITSIEYSIAVQKGNEVLLDKINIGIKDLRIKGKYQDIFDKWVPEQGINVRSWVKPFAFLISIVIMIFLFISFIQYRIRKMLKKQVSIKTQELQKINKELKLRILENYNYNELNNYIVKSNPCAIIVIDNHYRITLCNEKVKSFLNKSADPIGTNVMDIPLASYILERYDSKIFNQNIAITNCELKYTDDNNARKVYRYNIYQLLNIKEEIYGVVLSFEDITQEVLFKEESFEKQKNKALNKIIAGIAHEIRNPLTSIKIAIDTKLFRHNDIQIQNQMSDLLSKEIDRVNCLINDLIDYAKPYVAQKERIEVQELVQFCIGLMLPGLRNKQVKVCVEVEQNLIIFEDRKQIEQVLINIILNASESIFEKIKLEPNNQHIYKLLITAQNCNNGYINIQVYDEGVGMNNDAIKQSTDLFYTTKTNGKGIGLSFCKQVIEDNGGKIIIRSELNKYAEVTIKLRSVAIGNYSLNKLYKSY